MVGRMGGGLHFLVEIELKSLSMQTGRLDTSPWTTLTIYRIGILVSFFTKERHSAWGNTAIGSP